MSVMKFNVSMNFAWKMDIAKIAISGELQIQEAWGSHSASFSPMTHQDLGSLRESPMGRGKSSPKKSKRRQPKKTG